MEAAIIALIGIGIGYFISIEKIKYERSYRYYFAALDQKLKAHQEAYNLSRGLPEAAHKSLTNHSFTTKCEKWYGENCLYLEPEARDAFFKAFRKTMDYYVDLELYKSTKDDSKLRQAWDVIVSAPAIIEDTISKPLKESSRSNPRKYNYKGKIKEKN